MVEADASGGRDRIHTRTFEQHAVQLARKAAVALLAQQPCTQHVFVDFSLQLEFEQRDWLVVTGVPCHVDEMADAFGGSEIVREILVCQVFEWIVAREAFQHGSVDVKRHRERIAFFGHEELLVSSGALLRSLRDGRDWS